MEVIQSDSVSSNQKNSSNKQVYTVTHLRFLVWSITGSVVSQPFGLQGAWPGAVPCGCQAALLRLFVAPLPTTLQSDPVPKVAVGVCIVLCFRHFQDLWAHLPQ